MSNTQKNEEKNTQNDSNTAVEVKKLENSEVEISGEIAAEEFETYRADAMKRFSEKAEVAGFRKGHVPEDVIEGKFGEMAILEEMAQSALTQKYPEILQNEKIEAIGQPEINITKIAKGSPLGFTIKTAVMPEIKLPDYKTLAEENTEKEEAIEITDEEIDETIKYIRNERKRMKEQEQKDKSDETETKEIAQDDKADESTETAEPQKETDQKSDEKEADEEKKEELPPLTDEEAKELGFDGIEDLKKMVRDNLKNEKEGKKKDERRNKIIEALMAETKMDIPKVVVDNELERMMAQIQGEIANMGLEWDQYLEHVGKTEEELREASRPDAEKRAKSQLIINKIAVTENIEPKKEDVEKEVKQLTEKYDDADENRARAYVEMVLTNEAVLRFLEGEESTETTRQADDESQEKSKEGETGEDK